MRLKRTLVDEKRDKDEWIKELMTEYHVSANICSHVSAKLIYVNICGHQNGRDNLHICNSHKS